MKIDMHCHVLGNGLLLDDNIDDVYYNIEDNPVGDNEKVKKWFIKNVVFSTVENYVKGLGGSIINHKISSENYLGLMTSLLKSSSEIDSIVILAMDRIFDPKDGKPQDAKTELYAPNKYLFNKLNKINEDLKSSSDINIKKKKFLFGASVSPNRPDWETHLNYVCNETNAVLLKWIPSAMHIEVNNEKHKPFYKMLASRNLPLLCHVGPEYAFIEGAGMCQLDYYRNLDLPLSCGVKVIAAHCGTPVFPWDINETDGFIDYINKINSGSEIRLWADTSALTMTTRIGLLKKVLNGIKPEWLVHGSDFPVPVSAIEHLPFLTYDVSLDEYIQLLNEKNPIDLDVKIKRAHAFPDSILDNAEKVLRMP